MVEKVAVSGSEKNRESKSSMPLSWMWENNSPGLTEKISQIEHSFHEFYDYGASEMHAGPIKESLRKEINRMHKLFDIDRKLQDMELRIAEHDKFAKNWALENLQNENPENDKMVNE